MAKPRQLAQSAARGWGGDERYSKPIDDRDQFAYLKRDRQRRLDAVRGHAQQLLRGEGPDDWWNASDDAPAQTKQRRATWREMQDAVDSYIEAQTRFEQAYRAGIAELPNTAMMDPDDPTTDRYSAFSVRAALRTNPELTDPIVEASRRRLGFAKHPDWFAVEWDWFAYRAACARDVVEMEWLDRAVSAASDFLGNPAAFQKDLEQKMTELVSHAGQIGGSAGLGGTKRPHTALIRFWRDDHGSKPSREELLDMLEAEWETVRDDLERATKKPCPIDDVIVRRAAGTVSFKSEDESVTLPFKELGRILRRRTK